MRYSSYASWTALLVACALAGCAVGVDAGNTSDDDAGPGPGNDAGAANDATTAPDAAARLDAGGGADTNTAPETGSPDTNTSACAAHGYTGALVTFDLAALAGTEASAPPKSSASGVTGGALSRSSSLTVASGSGSLNSSGWATTASADPGKYYSFTVTPAAGCSAVLTSLALDVKASGTGPVTADVATSVDSYAARRGPFGADTTATVQLAGVSASGSIEIRVFGYGASAAGGTWRIQNTMTLSGSIN